MLNRVTGCQRSTGPQIEIKMVLLKSAQREKSTKKFFQNLDPPNLEGGYRVAAK